MSLAKIFTPIRWQSGAAEQRGTSPALFGVATDWPSESRAGTQPVTNPSPPGPDSRAAQEQGWLALLELVFDETGWPDA